MRSIDTFQQGSIDIVGTYPVYLIQMEIASVEYLSTSDDFTVDGIIYTGSDVSLISAQDWMSAKIKLAKTNSRIGEIVSGGWERAPCSISMLPVQRYPMLIDPSYVDPDYFLQGVLTGDPILLLKGVVTHANINNSDITLDVSDHSLVGKYTPRTRITSAILNHLPQAGTKFEWQGEIYILEAR
jgi:hypothetical protein